MGNIYGYTTIGSNSRSKTNGSYFGQKFTIGSVNEYINSITIYTNNFGGTTGLSVSIFSITGGSQANILLASGVDASAITTTSPSWFTVSLSSPYLATANTTYFACFWSDNSYMEYFDSAGSNMSFERDNATYNSWVTPDPHDPNYGDIAENSSCYVNTTLEKPHQVTGVQAITGVEKITF